MHIPILSDRGVLDGVLGLLGGVTSIIASLSPSQQGGSSVLGLLSSPTLSKFLVNNPLPYGYPWGQSPTKGNTPYTDVPNTGVTRYYDFTVTRGVIAPDGVQKNVILINGAFPGPTIEANWGDRISVTVHNNIYNPQEGMAFHWHGLLQKTSQWYDGVVSVSQCPIPPGSSFTYNFQADTYGTSWYHSHYSAQYVDGLFGAMIIYGPQHVDYDIDVGPVILSDYFHKSYLDITKDLLTTEGYKAFTDPAVFAKVAPNSNNNLINGRMTYDCSMIKDGTPCTSKAGLSKFKFTKGKTHRLRLINAGAEGLQRFSIDGHMLTVIANDFVPIKPYTTKVVTLAIGQRTDILVTPNGAKTDSYWMRSNISTVCSGADQPYALAAIYMDNADTTKAPTSQAWDVPDPGTCANDDLATTVPYYEMPAPGLSSGTLIQNYNIAIAPNASGILQWSINGNSFRADYNNPLLSQVNSGNLNFPSAANVYNLGKNTSVTWVINNPQAGTPAHPIHLHGHHFWVLHEGPGEWDGKSIVNVKNPQRRDVQMVRAGGHLVIQYENDNPGMWGLHWFVFIVDGFHHIAWHSSVGFYINTLEQPDAIRKFNIPGSIAQTCNEWKQWSSRNVVDQIDSGL